ncbi:FAD-binding protein [Sinirhodobacter ferrireducens]|uniref:FAD-binding protein n=1 Tax=Paenirhodobacter ferrireducens TaxID=1215032 RepID=A0A443LAR5_9RHOB|nr:FAD-binding protein [Sinirhodobacter ferrireducens]RWR46270.1 FAD-binding protein [Sinirhodobacter ferrireducens]
MRVESEAELVEAVRGARAPLRVVGGGTRGEVGAGERLEVAISGVRLYEPGALTLIAGAGTPLSEIEAVVAAEGQRLPFEPPRWGALLGLAGESTIGGVAAANVSGPRRVQAGACRDSLIGLRFVDGAGIAVQAGGRVMKNVTGYDLVKLLAGSRGRLGVLSEVAFKLLPAAPAQATVRAEVPLSEAGRVLAAALASPFDVSGAGWLPGQGAVLRLEGLEGSVGYRAGRLAALLAPWGARIEREGSVAIWRDLAEVRPFHGRAGDIWRFSVKPSEAAAIAARLDGEVVLDWGGGLIWALLPEGTDARAQAAPYTGHATCLRGRAPRAEPEAPAVAALSRALQARFDPRGILDPERAG